MGVEQRKWRPSCSGELQVALRLLASFGERDLKLAAALVLARFNVGVAAREVLDEDYDAVRRALYRLRKRMEKAMPGLDFGLGMARRREVSYDQYERMAESLGVGGR